jgi:hypothetical protein
MLKETGFRCILRGDLEPIRISSGDAHRVAVQIIVNNLHFSLNDLRGKRFVRGPLRLSHPSRAAFRVG